MPKATSGQKNIVHQAGHSRHQKDADAILTEHGFEFVRRSGGHGSNVYKHPDGRRISVPATPRNNSEALQYLRQAIRSPRLGLKAGESPAATPEKETQVSTTTVSPVTLLLSMADPFLLKEPKSRRDASARNSALVGWMKRALEKHGPVESKDLIAACEEMGFSRSATVKARQAANVQSWTIPGAAIGKGRGGNVVWASLIEQMPEDASSVSRGPGKSADVAAVSGEGDTQTAENGAGRPEGALGIGVGSHYLEEPQHPPLTPAEAERVTRHRVAETKLGMQPGALEGALQATEEMQGIAPPPLSDEDRALVIGPLDSAPLSPLTKDYTAAGWPAEQPFRPDAMTAAQMLLDTLGLKTLDPHALDGLRVAVGQVADCQQALSSAVADLQHALRMLS
jgi:predicted RNA binding protein YcfA (HicA-like mRNA interferase family)